MILSLLLLLPHAHAAPPVDDGHAVRAILSATPFELTTSYTYDWSAEHPDVKSGTLLVLDVDPAWLVPSDIHQAVLFVGAVPAERVNTGFPDGRLVVIVPAGVDVARSPVYFSGYDLPERIDAAAGQKALEGAVNRGALPLPMTLATGVVLRDHEAVMKAGL